MARFLGSKLSAPTTLWSLQRSPGPLAGFKGGEEERGEGKGQGGKRKISEGKGGKGKGKGQEGREEGRGKGEGLPPPLKPAR